MDKLAAALGLDPVELRLRNALASGDVLPTGQRVTGSLPVAEVIRRAAALPIPEPEPLPRDPIRLPGGSGEHDARPGHPPRHRLRGRVQEHLLLRGLRRLYGRRVRLFGRRRRDRRRGALCGAEVGQGVINVIVQVARTELGIDDVVLPRDDGVSRLGGLCLGFPMTWMAAGAVQLACRAQRRARCARGHARRPRDRRRARLPPPGDDAARPGDRPDHGRARPRRLRLRGDASRRRGRRRARADARRLDRHRAGRRGARSTRRPSTVRSRAARLRASGSPSWRRSRPATA